MQYKGESSAGKTLKCHTSANVVCTQAIIRVWSCLEDVDAAEIGGFLGGDVTGVVTGVEGSFFFFFRLKHKNVRNPRKNGFLANILTQTYRYEFFYTRNDIKLLLNHG